jgi:hypothetical protein
MHPGEAEAMQVAVMVVMEAEMEVAMAVAMVVLAVMVVATAAMGVMAVKVEVDEMVVAKAVADGALERAAALGVTAAQTAAMEVLKVAQECNSHNRRGTRSAQDSLALAEMVETQEGMSGEEATGVEAEAEATGAVRVKTHEEQEMCFAKAKVTHRAKAMHRVTAMAMHRCNCTRLSRFDRASSHLHRRSKYSSRSSN